MPDSIESAAATAARQVSRNAERATKRTPELRPPQWYKDAVIYQLHVKAFFDSNDDGIGDFPGLTSKLDYIRDLGVNTIWLLPFYPSPLKDDGYDIADYRRVHPDYGTIGDFRQFIREAHRRDLRVITELVINHTSDQHPWFQAARAAPPGSPKRDYYVWSDTDKKWPETRIIFTDTETSNWAWDPVAKAYYWHRFFSHQPDLNFDNPRVIRAVLKVMGYWFDMGVDGVRLDAIPYLCERDGTNNENLPETHAVLRTMRAELDRSYPDRFFLAEVNQWPEDVREYFGDGDQCHMAYHFPLMPRIYMAVAEEDRHPIIDIMQQTPDIPDNCQWAIFLRNHDELTLEMVTARERASMYQAYAADSRMRINVGIRRRLAPLMENNRRKIELVNSLLMTLIGSPILYYGDEIGMGDNVFLGDRHGVRTPMQWTSDRNAGFSRTDPQRLYLPPVMDPMYGYNAVNVEAQSRNPSSLLNWTKRLIAVRKAHPALSRGTLRFIRPGNRKILAYVRENGTQVLLLVANLSRSAQPVELDLSEFKGRVPLELLGRTPFPPIGDLPYMLTLPGWGFYEFSLESDVAAPTWHEDRPARPELPLLVVPDGVRALVSEDTAAQARPGRALMARRVREQLERDVLPAFLREQRWFAGKSAGLVRTTLIEEGEWGPADAASGRWLLAIARAELADGESQLYSLPLAVAWEDGGAGEVRRAAESSSPAPAVAGRAATGTEPTLAEHERIASLQHCTVARVRQHARVGVLFDALWDEAFCRALVQAMGRNETHALPRASLVFTTTRAYPQHVSDPLPAISHPALEQSNSMVIFGSQLVLKAYRRLRRGINPEIEIGRFLTDVSPFANIAPVLGTLEYQSADGEPVALAVLQAFVPNQGSGWQVTLDYLGRALEAARAQDDTARALGDAASAVAAAAPTTVTTTPASTSAAGEHAPYLALARTLGQRTAEMHLALAHVSGDPAFDPEPAGAEDVQRWVDRVHEDVVVTLTALGQAASSLAPDDARAAQSLIAGADALSAHLTKVQQSGIVANKMRCHGDYHLGQVLVANHDFVIVDFEGEPSRPLAERRAKHSPLRDVAGMLRSFDYAAAVALREATRNEPADRPRLAPYAHAWRTAASDAFLAAYFETVSGPMATARVLPTDVASAQALLDLFVIEKALYEIRYEIASRPDWVGVPLAGLTALLDRSGAESAAESAA